MEEATNLLNIADKLLCLFSFMPTAGDDFDLIDKVFSSAAAKKDAVGVANLLPSERIVYFIWAALGIIENGSFQYFFENDMDADAVAESFDALGLVSHGNSFRDAKNLLDRGGPLRGWDEKLHFLQQNEAAFDSLAQKIISGEKDIETRLGSFIRSRPDLFRRK